MRRVYLCVLGYAVFVLAFFFDNAVSASSTVNIPATTDSSENPLYESIAGKLTGIRILNDTKLHKTEVSFTENGTMSVIGNVTNTGTFLETFRSNETIFGQGRGIIMSTGNGEFINWTSYDLGQISPDKSERYRGIILFDALSNGTFDFLNNTIGLYTTDVGSNGSSMRQIWLWK